ncbi:MULTISPECIES: hypothetical protein [Acinetobacter]|uniref:hypothetical protein n=1 Tax=Acinetobacter TaxID=469 RepID=UPI000C2C8438|nr:hypothetical protein [Acinetobacter haemolyticus]ATZ66538.1 hypothetical protein BSR56_03625 [Acinetobacter haemolyticus]
MPRWIYGVMGIALIWLVWTNWLKPVPNLTQVTAQGVQIVELETYEGAFRVLARKDYHAGRESEFSPIDLAVGWGDMAKPEIYKQVEISQRNRWYYWRVDSEPPIALRQIAVQSANMHLVPATEEVAKQLKQIKKDDLVYLKGALIEIQAPDGWRWRSSLSREDTGSGACELMRVDRVVWH